MDCTILGMQRLNVVKVVGDSPHLDHSVPVIGIEALDFRPPNLVSDLTNSLFQYPRTCFGTRLEPAWGLVQESL